MKIQEIEQALEFMQLIGYNPEMAAQLLSDYFQVRGDGKSADEAAQLVFDEVASRSQTLEECVRGFHLKMCRIAGYTPEEVAEAVDKFYNKQ